MSVRILCPMSTIESLPTLDRRNSLLVITSGRNRRDHQTVEASGLDMQKSMPFEIH